MKFDWHLYYELAQKLFDDSETNKTLSDAFLRSSISRAYFASHCLVRDYLLNSRQITPPRKKEKIHQWVIQQIRQDPDVSNLSVTLSRLRNDRINADYNGKKRNFKRMAEGALIGAKIIIDTLDQVSV